MRTGRLLSTDEDLPGRTRDFVAALAQEAGLPPERAYWLRLAVDEISTNIACHGYRGRCGNIDLTGDFDQERVWVTIHDQAAAFDAREHLPKTLPAAAARPQLGGNGLLLALRGLDGFEHEYDGTGNTNTLIINRSPSRSRDPRASGGTDEPLTGRDRR